MKKQPDTIDEYVKTFPENVQVILEKMRQTIRKAAPDAVEASCFSSEGKSGPVIVPASEKQFFI